MFLIFTHVNNSSADYTVLIKQFYIPIILGFSGVAASLSAKPNARYLVILYPLYKSTIALWGLINSSSVTTLALTNMLHGVFSWAILGTIFYYVIKLLAEPGGRGYGSPAAGSPSPHR